MRRREVAFAGERRTSVTVEPAYPEWMTWAQRAVYRHVAFHGRVTIPADPDGCWEWAGCRVAAGYGRVGWEGKTRWAHRLSRSIAFGDSPEAVCHTCDNPPCVNPEHLRSGTLSDNTAEMWSKGRARVHYVNALFHENGLERALEALRLVGYARGRRARIEVLAAQLGCSYRTLYRLLNADETPLVYRDRVAKRTRHAPEEIAA